MAFPAGFQYNPPFSLTFVILFNLKMAKVPLFKLSFCILNYHQIINIKYPNFLTKNLQNFAESFPTIVPFLPWLFRIVTSSPSFFSLDAFKVFEARVLKFFITSSIMRLITKSQGPDTLAKLC
ncbi:LOW QUALITY PROTEIN: hypothetical protein TorRG33x02_178280 [Trema orientale]|uniref:Uncharacterized protein n=1 Tax=Trema orientale TaxID=63057 RepID=A0A2P5ELE1_TREOI|nr:LOW QUALITY PROTEIN: hypothetical protein TorRG33x02_178280 [Trema orientale]